MGSFWARDLANDQRMKTVVHENPFYSVTKEEYELPNGQKGVYFGIRGLRTAFVVPFLDEKTLVLTYQWRHLLNSFVWEFPAGRIDEGEEQKAAAARELEEEAGYRAGSLEYIGWYCPCNGLSDEHTYVFIARDLHKTEQHLDRIEYLSVHSKSIDEFESMINDDRVNDGMTLAAWQLVKRFL